MSDIAPVFALASLFVLIGWLFWVLHHSRRRRHLLDTTAELHKRLFDKLSSAAEVNEFIQSQGGQKLLNSLKVPAQRTMDRIISAIQTGAVLLCLGAGLVVIGLNVSFEGGEAFTILGVISISVAIGFVASAVIARTLSVRWKREEENS